MVVHNTAPFTCERHFVASDRQRVVAVGEIDIATGVRLSEALREAQAVARHVVLDLDGTAFIDTSGIRILLAASARARATAGTFEIVHPAAPVTRLANLVGAKLALEG